MSAGEEFTIKALSDALRKGDISSRELTREVFTRIERLDPQLHAFLTLIPERAFDLADEADRQLLAWRKDPQHDLSPLLGIPLAVKDVLALQDVRCTCGS